MQPFRAGEWVEMVAAVVVVVVAPHNVWKLPRLSIHRFWSSQLKQIAAVLLYPSLARASSMFLATDMWRKAFCLLQLGAEVPPPLGHA